MCLPSLEYPGRDALSSVRFSGGLAPGHYEAGTDRPSWWDEIIQNKSRTHKHHGKKHIVTTTQDTAQMNYKELIIPSLIALQHREDIIAVAIFGNQDSKPSLAGDFPSCTTIPANARIIDFSPSMIFSLAVACPLRTVATAASNTPSAMVSRSL